MNKRIAEVTAQLLEGPVVKEHTFIEASAQYLANLERRGKNTRRENGCVKSIIEEIGDLPLSHIHQMTLQPWIDAQKGTLASGTVKRVLKNVLCVLNYAAGYLRDGNTPWLIGVPKLSAPDWGDKIKPYRLTWEEQDRIVETLTDYLVAPVLFAVSTGAREQEVVTLRWDQHRPMEGFPEFAIWWIPPEIRKGSSKLEASAQEGRFLVCNQMAREVIANQPRTGEWIFPGVKRPHLRRINDRGWVEAKKRHGIQLRVHDLRHTFGGRLSDVGVPLDVRKSLLGHRHSDITVHYSPPGLSWLLREAEKVRRPEHLPPQISQTSHRPIKIFPSHYFERNK